MMGQVHPSSPCLCYIEERSKQEGAWPVYPIGEICLNEAQKMLLRRNAIHYKVEKNCGSQRFLKL